MLLFQNSCVELISSGQPMLACGILRDPVLCRLKPLILLLSWNKVKIVPDVVKFVDAFEGLYSVNVSTDPDLDIACRRLVCKAKLLLWALNNSCFKKHKTIDREIPDLLSNIQTCSSLNILRHCVRIEQIERSQLDSILSTWTSELETSNLQSENGLAEKSALGAQLSLERMHDRMLLLGYYILYDFFEIVQNCIKLDQLIIECSRNRSNEDATISTPPSGKNSPQALAEDSLTQFYALHIAGPLKAVAQKISTLYPLTFRAEILENVFSLLFLTHQNVTSGISSACSSDSSDEGHEGEDKVSQTAELNNTKTKLPGSPPEYNTRKSVRYSRERSTSKSRGLKGISGSRETHPSSENASSGNASRSLARLGFLCNQFLVRDLLDCLKDCVFDAISLSKAQTTFEPDLTDIVLSSVDTKSLPNRFSTLSRCVNEALWKFQLVANDWIPSEFGMFPAHDVIRGLNLNEDWSCQFYEERNSDDDEEMQSLPANVNQELLPEPRGKSSSHRKLSRTSGTTFAGFCSTKSLISKMLATPESLLNICLNESSLVKAQQVIMLFGMEHTSSATDISFALDYQKAVEQLLKLAPSNRTMSSSSRSTKYRSSTWEAIVKAAQSGMDAASNETLIADELLASHKVPGLEELEKQELKSQLANFLPDPIDWRAFVRTDLALVACANGHACRNLLEASYLALRGNSGLVPPPKTARSRFSNQPRGVLSIIEDMLALISPELDAEEGKEAPGVLPAIRDILLQALDPVSSKVHQKSKSMWKRVTRAVNQLHSYLEDEQRSDLESSTGSASPPNYPQEQKPVSQHPSHSAYRKLMKLASMLRSSLEDNLLWQSQGAAMKTTKLATEQKSPAYLCSLFDYAKNLATVLPQLETDPTQYHGSYFSTFKQSPVSILEKLVFSKSTPPKELEEFAKNLNLDLLKIIIQRCCPIIPATCQSSVGLTNRHSSSEENAGAGDKDQESMDKRVSIVPQVIHEHQTISEELLSYVGEKCWLAAVLIRALGYVTIAANGQECAETVHEDPVVLHPVLHRFLEKRSQLCSPGDASLILHPGTCLDNIVLNVENCAKRGDWMHALKYLNSWECQNPDHDSQLNSFRNQVLSKLAEEANQEFTNEGCPPWTYIMQLKDMTFKAKVVLEQYVNWPAYAAMAALNDCIACGSLEHDSDEHLKLCLRKVRIYHAIAQHIASEGMKVDLGVTAAVATWQDVARTTNVTISALIDGLLNAKKYSVVVDLSTLHDLPAEKREVVDDCSVLSLLQGPIMNPTVLQQALASASLPQQRLSISLHILDYICTSSEDSSLLLCILETVDLSGVRDLERLQFFRKKIGIKIFLCLPAEERTDYMDFIAHPHIMIEQFLINIKIETLQRAFQMIRDDLKLFVADPLLSFDSINAILELYATKAVDFRVVQSTVPATSRNVVGLSAEKVVNRQTKFPIPQKVPTKQQWIPDAAVMECMVCSVERFSMFNRRHHCRRCGRVCCSMCSQRRKKVSGYEDVPVRVCEDCFSADSASSSGGTPDSLERRLKARFGGGSLDDSSNSEHEYSPFPDSHQKNSRNVAWKLSLDAAHNATAREEFSYEQAPSISLCLSICDLHWDQHTSGHKLLDFARTLFKFLQPISPGVVNPEIDYCMIITMLKSVLLSAKVKFSKTFDNAAVTRCDVYLGLADLLNLLVISNCKHLIPTVDLTKDNISSFPYRRLRELLMKEERWNLALEISTKGGLDVLGVWVSWGMVCLQMGHYNMAREKFSHCLQRGSTKRPQSDSLLLQILQQLESSTITGLNETAVTASLSKLKSIKTMGSSQLNISGQKSCNAKLNPTVKEECLYYIKAYGSHSTILAFYVRHNEWQNGVRTVFDDVTFPVQVFVEELVMPSLHRACFTDVKLAMKSCDPSLESWTKYLEALGRHLKYNGLVHVLYELQVFMKDDIRAAMSCIQFFHQGTNDYAELHDRLQYLQEAKQHFESFKQKHSYGRSSKRIGLVLPMTDVERYLRAIDLQVEVTNFLNEKSEWCQTLLETCSTKSDTQSVGGLSASKSSICEPDSEFSSVLVPTIFGSMKDRAYVVVLMVLGGTVVMEGFPIATRIMQELNLHATNVYTLIAKKLVEQKRLTDVSPFLICMKRIGGQNDALCDRVVLKTITHSIELGYETKDVELLIRLLSEDKSKIDALILCGKLKSAYLLAVKQDSMDSILRIVNEAEQTGQVAVKSICEKWLNLKQKNSK